MFLNHSRIRLHKQPPPSYTHLAVHAIVQEIREGTTQISAEFNDLSKHGQELVKGVKSKRMGASVSIAKEATHLATRAPQMLQHVKRERQVVSTLLHETSTHSANVAGELKGLTQEVLECISSFVERYETSGEMTE